MDGKYAKFDLAYELYVKLDNGLRLCYFAKYD